MTDEQEKAIGDLKFFNQGEYITKEMEESAKVVLEMLKEKDKEIKILGELFDRRGEQLELKQIQIELMAEYIADISDCPLENCDTDLDCENRCNADIEKECWIKYFKKKAKGE